MSNKVIIIFAPKDAGKTASREASYISKSEINYEKLANQISEIMDYEVMPLIKQDETGDKIISFNSDDESKKETAQEIFDNLEKILNPNDFELGFNKKKERDYLVIRNTKDSFIYKGDVKELGFWNKIGKKILGKSSFTATGVDQNLIIDRYGLAYTLLEYGGEELLGSRKDKSRKSLENIFEMYKKGEINLQLVHIIDANKLSPYTNPSIRKGYIKEIKKCFKLINKILNKNSKDKKNINSILTHVVNKTNLPLLHFVMENPDEIEILRTDSMNKHPADSKRSGKDLIEYKPDELNNVLTTILGIRDTGVVDEANSDFILGAYKTIPIEYREKRLINVKAINALWKSFYLSEFEKEIPELKEINEIIGKTDKEEAIKKINELFEKYEAKAEPKEFLNRDPIISNRKILESVTGIIEKSKELKKDYLELFYETLIKQVTEKEAEWINERLEKENNPKEKLLWVLKREKEKGEILRIEDNPSLINKIEKALEKNDINEINRLIYQKIGETDLYNLHSSSLLPEMIGKSFKNLIGLTNQKINTHESVKETASRALIAIEKNGSINKPLSEGKFSVYEILSYFLKKSSESLLMHSTSKKEDNKNHGLKDYERINEIIKNIHEKSESSNTLGASGVKDKIRINHITLNNLKESINEKELGEELDILLMEWEDLLTYKELEEKYLDDIARTICIPLCFSSFKEYLQESRIIGNIALDSTIMLNPADNMNLNKDFNKIIMPDGKRIFYKENTGLRIIQDHSMINEEITLIQTMAENNLKFLKRILEND